MAETGVLTEEDQVELLEGWIAPKMIHNPPHDATVDLIDEAIRRQLPPGWRTRVQSSITTDDSEPEPDVAIVRGEARDYSQRHPGAGDIGLLVEIAETSLDRDRAKCRLYARAAIPIYWIANLIESRIEAYTEPTCPSGRPKYAKEAIYRRGDTIPLLLDGQEIARLPVDSLLP